MTRMVAGITVSLNAPGPADAVPAAGPTANGKATTAQAAAGSLLTLQAAHWLER